MFIVLYLILTNLNLNSVGYKPSAFSLPFCQTNQELDNTKNRQEKTEAKSNEATHKAEKERNHIKNELDTVRDALSAIK